MRLLANSELRARNLVDLARTAARTASRIALGYMFSRCDSAVKLARILREIGERERA